MSVILYDPVEKTHILLMENGPYAGRRWSARLGVCDNPCCGCRQIDFECAPADTGRNPAAESVKFVLDVEKCAIYRDPGSKPSSDSKAFAEEVAAEAG